MAQMIPTAEAADRLGVTRRQVNYLLQTGSLKGKQLSRRFWVVDSKSVDAYQQQRAARAAARAQADDSLAN